MSDLLKGAIGFLLWMGLTIGSYLISKPCICASLPFVSHDFMEATQLSKVKKPPLSATVKRLPIDFKWADATPYTNIGFPEYKKELLNKKAENNLLEITGVYMNGERNTSSFANMGIARAQAVKALLINDIKAEQIRIASKRIPAKESATSDFFEAISFKWILKRPTSVEVFKDRTIIRFPFNSIQKEVNPTIDEYLTNLANRIIETKERVNMTGHTDNIGGAEANYKLGLDRAKMIRDILIEKGVNEGQIKTFSKGESVPVVPNLTKEGQQKNRRVVLRLLKK